MLQAADALDCQAQLQLADGLDGLLRAVQTAKGMPEFGPCLSCVHFCRNGRDAAAGSCHCALTDEPIPADETAKICVEFESAAPA